MEKKLTVIPPSQTNGNAKSANSSQCRVAAYCRVSTEQEEQLGSFVNQIAYYTDYINEKEGYQLAGIFSDEGEGWKRGSILRWEWMRGLPLPE